MERKRNVTDGQTDRAYFTSPFSLREFEKGGGHNKLKLNHC